MWFPSWLRNQTSIRSPRGRTPHRPAPPHFRPRLEALEERWLPSTLTVTSAADSGAGSLRADIAAAHNGDTIVFAPSLDGQTITLTSGELLIKHNLTIAGPAAGQLTVSGNHASRVFELAATANQVTLSGLTISNGSANGGSAFQGGGILVDSGAALTLNNSTVSGNSANQGAGINNEGTMTISGSVVADNVATGSAFGGGIYNGGSSLTISGSTLSGNWAYAGGGIYNAGGTLTVNGGSTLSGNSAGEGGGIFAGAGTVTVSNTTLSSNSAQYGGGIDNFHAALTVSGSTLANNSASSVGGGIYNNNGGGSGTVTVKNSSSIINNTAPTGDGPDVYNLGVLHLDSSSTIGILDGNPAVLI